MSRICNRHTIRPEPVEGRSWFNKLTTNGTLLFFALFVVFGAAFADDPAPILSKSAEDFSRYKPGQFPVFFKTWPFQRGDAKQVYRVQAENGRISASGATGAASPASGKNYLAAFDDKDLSEQIFREFDWNVKAFPHFKWKWRAKVLPKNGAENNGATNDSACGVYVVFGRTSGTALKFVWSTTLAAGTVFEKKPGEMIIEVLESGPKNLNQWREESVNIPEAHQKLLRRPMKREPTGFAILTDGNATHSASACDYADFAISAVP